WPGDASASLEMTSGHLVFHDEGIYIRPTGTFIDAFSNNPQISTYDNLRIDRVDFSPTSLAFNMLGNNNTYIRMDDGNFPVLNIMKNSPSYTVDANTILDVNYLNIVEGTLDVNGQTVYSEYLVQIEDGGILKMTNSSDKIVTDDVDFLSGSDANVTAGNIEVKGKWKFHNGTNAQLGSGNIVRFKSGGASHNIECDDADAEFGSVVIDVDTYINGGSTQPVRIAGDCDVNAPYEFDVQAESLIVDGELDINNGALMTLFAASNDGSLVVNDGCILQGELDVGIGTATFNDGLFSASTSQLSIDDGICAVYPSSQTLIQGGFDLSNDGLFEIHNTLSFSNTASLNITGGKIRIQLDLHLYIDFNPSGGTVEFFGSTNDSQIGFHGNNGAFYDLDIDKSFSSLVVLLNDISIQNNITINSGYLSSGFSTSYDIDVGGDWTNNVGTSGFTEGTGTVTFYGSGLSDITTDETFYNLKIDKPSSYVNLMDDIQVLGDIVVNNGDLKLVATGESRNHSFWGDITVYAGTISGASNSSSTVTLKGTSDQILTTISASSLDFYTLMIDKTGSKNSGQKAQSVLVSGDGFEAYRLTIDEGTMNLNGSEAWIENYTYINNGGKLSVGPGSTYRPGYFSNLNGPVYVNSGGVFEAIGSLGNEAVVIVGNSFNVESGATIGAGFAIFEDLKGDGINVKSGAIVSTSNSFDNCSFIGGETASTLLTINNNQTLNIDGANFPENTWGGTYNVAKTQNQGNVIFTNVIGSFANPTHENDAYNRIDWDGFVAGTWTGAVSTDWNNPANWEYSMKPTDTDDAVIPSGTPNDPRVYNASAFCKNLSIAAGASLHVDDETLTVDGDLEIYGELKMDNAAGVLNINDDIFWKPGSTDNITDGTINVEGNWTFEDGTTAKLWHENLVNFIGSNQQFIYCFDSDAEFGSVTINQSATSTWLSNTNTYGIHVTGDLTVSVGNIFQVQTNTLIVDGTLDIENTGEIYLVFVGGQLINNSDHFTLNGKMDIDGGEVLIHGTFETETTSELTINGGSFISDAPDYAKGWEFIRGTFNLSDGLFQLTNNSLCFRVGCITNITGGIIRTGCAFSAEAGTFQPLGGIVEMGPYGGSGSSGYIYLSAGNHFHNLIIDRSGSSAELQTDIIIQNDLEIIAGELSASSIFDIEIGGNWTNNVGSAGFLEAVGTVTFYGSSSSDITTDETFYDLIVDKTYFINDGVQIMDNMSVSVTNDLTITDGCMEMNDNSTLDVDGNLSIALDAGLNAQNDNNLNIFVGGDWDNLNTGYANNWGFSPGTSSTVTFDGSSVQYLDTDCSQEDFDNLVVDKSANNLLLLDDIQVYDDLLVSNGTLYSNYGSQNHILWGDVTVESGGDIWLSSPNTTITLVGPDAQTFTSNSSWDLEFENLVVDKTNSGSTVNVNNGGARANSLTVNEGTVNLYCNLFYVGDNANINDGGQINIQAGSLLQVSDTINVNPGGILQAIGTSGNEATVRVYGGEFNIESGANISAEYAIFDYLSGAGINIKPGSTIDPSHPFSSCSFIGDETGSTLLTINNNQTLTIDGAVFPENTWGGTYNVAKTQDQGQITFTSATGLFAGPTYENDAYDRIDWDGFSAGLWTGLVNNEWDNTGNWENNIMPTAIDNVTIPSGTPNDPWVTADDQECNGLTVEAGATLTITGKTLIVNGTLDIEDGATMTLYNGTTAGTLINNSLFNLYGELDVGIGSATINQSFFVQSTGVLSITDGSFVQPSGSTTNRIYGEFNLIGNGIFHPHNYIIFESGSVINVTDGLIRIEIDIRFLGSNTFQPTGGAIEIVGSFNNGIIVCDKSSGNYLNNLIINKTAGTAIKLTEDTEIKGDLNIDSGIFGIDISNDLDIEGNWTNNVGNAGTNIGFGTVTFTGSGNQTLTTVDTYENFPRLGINKSAGELTLFSDVQVSSDDTLRINAGALNLNGQSLTHAGDLEINNGGVLLLDGSSELSIADNKKITVNNGG
ncbi:MAG: hypothetical protein DRJ05_06665, partial [Bacteroidetes bacterium]